MNYDQFLRRLPKAEMHMHLEGAMRKSTFFDLARKHGLPLPSQDPEVIYSYDNLVDFLKVFDLCCKAMRDREDFARVTYESLEDGHRKGNLRYIEMFFNPTAHTVEGSSFSDVMDGIIDGARAAQRDFGVRCALIPAIYRAHSPQVAQEMLEYLVQHYRDDIIGIGSDSLPGDGTEGLQHFVEQYHFAQRKGLKTTVHAAESKGTAQNFTFALDVLGVDRIDHGYDVLNDPAVFERALKDQIVFTTTPAATKIALHWPDYTRHPIREMIERGLNVTINSDDNTMFETDIGNEFATICPPMQIGVDKAIDLSLAGVDGSWLDESDKSALKREFEAEIAGLRAELAA